MPDPKTPRTNLERELVRIWEQVLQRSPIGIDDNFFDLGGSSLQAVRVFAKIEELVHQRLPLSLILGAPTIQQLAVALLPGKTRDRWADAVAIQPRGRKPIFFCIGGGVMWRPMSEHLGTDQPVIHVGLDPRAVEKMNGPDALERLARDKVSIILEKQPQGPYYLGGFCCDAVFAFEIARQLTMYGHEIGLLVMFEPFPPNRGAMAQVAKTVNRAAFRLNYRLREMRSMGLGQLPQFLRSRWGGFQRFMQDLAWRKSAKSEVLKPKSEAAQVDQIVFVAASAYRAKPLSCPSLIFHCKDWPMLSAGDPYFGWRPLLTGSSETVEVPGDHDGILREPGVGYLAERLKAALAKRTVAKTETIDLLVDSDRRLSLGQSHGD
jgi:thioesterase domain-containing protein/acyl carrier protein